MLKLKIIAACLCLALAMPFTACTPDRPFLSSEAVQKTRLALGYALAPTYLPDGFDYAGDIGNTGSPPLNAISRLRVQQVYLKEVPGGRTAYLLLIYPLPAPVVDSYDEQSGLETPQNAISLVQINGQTAYVIDGSWSAETLKSITQGEEIIDPEWDYDGNISIRFAVEVHGRDRVWLTASTVFPTDEVTSEDLIKIARSVVVV